MAPRGCILGDSLHAVCGYAREIEYYMLGFCDIARGYTVNNIAVAGGTIASQEAAWSLLGDKTSYDWILILVGINDRDPAESAATALARYQHLVDTITADKKASAVIFTSTLTPCKQFLIDTYGPIIGEVAQQKWVDMNIGIRGQGPDAITGMVDYADAHTLLLDDGAGSLALQYDVGDHLHITAAARSVVALDCRGIMQRFGFFTEDLRIAAQPYPWRIAI